MVDAPGRGTDLEDYAIGLAEYSEALEETHAFFEDNYRPAVDAYEQGEISGAEFEQTMTEMLEMLDALDEKNIELNSYRVKTPSLETAEVSQAGDVDPEIAERLFEEGFEMMTRKPSSRYAEAFTDAEIAYQVFDEMTERDIGYENLTRPEQFDSILEELESTGEQLRERVMKYEESFLDEEFGKTMAALSIEQMDEEERERLEDYFGPF